MRDPGFGLAAVGILMHCRRRESGDAAYRAQLKWRGRPLGGRNTECPSAVGISLWSTWGQMPLFCTRHMHTGLTVLEHTVGRLEGRVLFIMRGDILSVVYPYLWE